MALAVLAAPALHIRPARAAVSVTLAGPGDWFQHAFVRGVLPGFHAAHPDITVFYLPAGNSSQVLAQIRQQRAVPSIDVALMGVTAAGHAGREGLLSPIAATEMPVIGDLIAEARPSGLTGPGVMIDSLAIGYAPDAAPHVPGRWRDLWDTGFGPHIAIQTPPDPLGIALTQVAATQFGNGDLSASLAIALNAVQGLAPRAVWNPIPGIYRAITDGEATIGPCWNATARSMAARVPHRFAAVLPDGGSPARTTTINLVRHGPAADAARVLIGWLLGPVGQRLITQATWHAPVNPKATIPPAALALAGATPAAVAHRVDLDGISGGLVGRITAAWRGHGLGSG